MINVIVIICFLVFCGPCVNNNLLITCRGDDERRELSRTLPPASFPPVNFEPATGSGLGGLPRPIVPAAAKMRAGNPTPPRQPPTVPQPPGPGPAPAQNKAPPVSPPVMPQQAAYPPPPPSNPQQPASPAPPPWAQDAVPKKAPPAQPQTPRRVTRCMIDSSGRATWYEDDPRFKRGPAEARRSLHVLLFSYGRNLLNKFCEARKVNPGLPTNAMPKDYARLFHQLSNLPRADEMFACNVCFFGNPDEAKLVRWKHGGNHLGTHRDNLIRLTQDNAWAAFVKKIAEVVQQAARNPHVSTLGLAFGCYLMMF